jgi:SAM-dependent methyltransferase
MDAHSSTRLWSGGSYEDEASNYLPVAGHLVDAVGVESEEEVLDVGCGTGNVAITAARRGADVTGVDILPKMLERAEENAEVASADARWCEGDACDLPFGDDTFGVTLSCLGHMYADPPDKSARELVRVTQSGGGIGFTSWTPTSLYPSMAGVVSTFVSRDQLPDYSEPPFMWGSEKTVRNRMEAENAVESIEFRKATVEYLTLSPEAFWRRTATTSGVFSEVLEGIDEDELPELRERMVETVERYFDGSRNTVELEYLLTTATVR